jgi:ribokinase
MSGICIVGSINMDLVATVERFPKPGETITGKEFGTFPGGKGANQAVAAGRLFPSVSMVGKVGDDVFGEQQVDNLKQNGVDTRGVMTVPGVSSGIAVIEVDESGENDIIVIPGANQLLDRDFIDSQFAWMLESDVFLFQLEIPLDTVFYAIRKLKEHGKIVVLDPAPARTLPNEMYQYVDYITPNETELQILTGIETSEETRLHGAALNILSLGVKTVILKIGKKGAYLISKDQSTHVPGFKVATVDTTAAGDTFNAAFAVALAKGYALKECVGFANAAAAISTTAKGAQSAMPQMRQVQSLLKHT